MISSHSSYSVLVSDQTSLPLRKRSFGTATFGPAIALAVFLGALALPQLGCSSQPSANVKYAVTAQENFTKGESKLDKKAWTAAAKYFAFVKARFPYSKFAVLAELRLADAEFGAKNFLQAIDAYKLFIKFHPTHDMVVNGYASFRIGESYYKMLPDDWWLLPPSREKDQSATSDAHRQLSSFKKKYPKSPYQKDASKRLTQINERLASHEMYVAQFYWDRNKPMGTVLRLRKLLDNHRGTKHDAPAMLLLGQAYAKVKMPERAKKAWQELINTFPQHQASAKARQKLTTISG